MRNKLFFTAAIVLFGILPAQRYDNDKIVRDYILNNHIREYKKSDLIDFKITMMDESKSLKGNLIKAQQEYHGFPVYNSLATALVRDNKIVYYNDNFVKNYTASKSQIPTVSKEKALQEIIQNLNNEENSETDFSENLKSTRERLVYILDNENLKLAYQFTISDKQHSHHWNILVDAHNNEILSKEDMVLSCSFHDGAFSHHPSGVSNNEIENVFSPFIGPENTKTNKQYFSGLVPDNASYNVFALPVEAPTFGVRSIVVNPWIPTSSPEGWHFDGTTHYTTTRGNNVYAYDDIDHDGISNPGVSPDGGVARNFNFPYNGNQAPVSNLEASITNAFYVNNMAHDIFYKFGFTESSRNFQNNNFGHTGDADDVLHVECLDGDKVDNANFDPGFDGLNPTMQLFLWTSNKILKYNSPADAVPRAPIGARSRGIGKSLNAIGVTGDVMISPVLNACAPLQTGALAGKIGLIERGGGCDYEAKAKNAFNAGATGVIIYNDAANGDELEMMNGRDVSFNIPSILITNSEGEFIKSKLNAGNTVNVTLKKGDVEKDSGFDNGVIIHEYGHGVSNRLTGDGENCLSGANKEQMGEGWSDFFALMLTNQPGDNASVARGLGSYLISQPSSGKGIRLAKYSPDFAINNYTYGATNELQIDAGTFSGKVTDPHSIGFVWATMLWDLHWKYVEKYGYSSNVAANTTSGSAKVFQLVMDGLKLQVCNPTFIDGRDAILAADQASNNGADKCMIWKTFAKRGLGVNASAGLKNIITDQVESFDVPLECNSALATNEISNNEGSIKIYPNPAKKVFFVEFPKTIIGKANIEIYDMSGKLVYSEDRIDTQSKKSLSTDSMSNGVYIIKIKALNLETSSKLIVNK